MIVFLAKMEESLKKLKEFNELRLTQVVNYEKFNHYAIVHHSSSIEGSTLTRVETDLLLDEHITPKGKPIDHSMMVLDHYDALLYAVNPDNLTCRVSTEFIKNINALVMRRTGGIVSTVLGSVDVAKGEYRKSAVTVGQSMPPSYDKVPALIDNLVASVNKELEKSVDPVHRLNLAFDTHFLFVTIHPFYDGNGRTSRLLMNHIQQRSNLPLSLVFLEDKAEYFQALIDTRKKDDLNIFRSFMHSQFQKTLQLEIDKLRESQKPLKGGAFSMIL